ncbi:MAG: hypothetical protein IT359_16235 [Gemmatimonadaceae bacterium]|nr:hypothetical protein [Gemmatimonadaceae bacterium]
MPERNLLTFSRHDRGTRINLLADPALGETDAEQVFECLLGRKPRRHLRDGDRSLVIPASGSSVHGGIKIKGAGLQGSSVRLGQHHAKPYPLPRYDAEGAATLDAAKDHARAYVGAMSYQQARHEFIVSRHVLQQGMRTFPGIAYGSLSRDGFTSWFTLLDWPFGGTSDWWRNTRERDSVERIAQAFGDTQRWLARHEVFMLLSGMVRLGDDFVRKDFHTAHIAGPNDSFLTRLAYFLFDTNFILAQFVIDRPMPDIADHRILAKTVYIRALTGRDHTSASIDRFKSLLVELKYADWRMEQRIHRLAADPVGRTLLETFLAESGEQPLFGELPPVVDNASDAAPPSPTTGAPARARWSWLRRKR